ncbi:hypothetical protein RFI_11727 [Reticulomyxa filosa]|uniref:Uncharacterized protein n=1 Tax=Reticulomyxa filosa TaxID=46433 RepID=X6NHH0_RETFI|nr:hypothetical protein RFI_11727 [Reticulomyxa filosa]|eukprot:ETO25411.1 hypothetical protein RFI_11727 [Reticulomyxa filosa]
MLPIEEMMSDTPRDASMPLDINNFHDQEHGMDSLDLDDAIDTMDGKGDDEEEVEVEIDIDHEKEQEEKERKYQSSTSTTSDSSKPNSQTPTSLVGNNNNDNKAKDHVSTHKRTSSADLNDHRSQQVAQLRHDCTQMRTQILRLEKEKEHWAESDHQLAKAIKRCDHLTELLTKMTDEKLHLRLKVEELESLRSQHNIGLSPVKHQS